ncbi:rhodanese-like domain-containing protein [Ramlibacter rhizophilus]|uniref:Rhodanese-like domain-containing protein n=1 Tax=Ramlibacter rhizophilus TaxID=1781167 RepID=A0A4Z0BQD6_9BURK|nr:rhodanese-like domain-containing protein [Ramlibacter rhizophilus]TFZ01497.1 rhodanese-like domain-containing protein [Ramlibacter rhizophilus]
MNFLIDNWMLISVALLSGGMLAWPLVKGGTGGGINPANAVQLINRERGVLVDVSDPEEFAQQHAGGARNVPLAQFEQRLPEVVKNKAVPVILVCPSGSRANRALPLAKKLGYEKAQVLGGGLRAWKDANLPVEKA